MDRLEEAISKRQSNKITNESKRTVCYFAGDVIGIVDALLEVGSIYQLHEDLAPLVCSNILDYIESPENIQYKNDCLKMAYFNYNEVVDTKYKKKTSQKQEKTLAKKLNGRMQPGSGAFLSYKGDVITEDFLVEAKFTDKNDYRLQLSIWNKIRKEAIAKDKIPLMEICIDQSKTPVNLIIVNPMDFYDVTNIDEEKFLEKFYSIPFTSNAESVKLDGNIIKEHIEYVNYNVANKMPAFLIQINKTLLFGIEIANFLKVRK